MKFLIKLITNLSDFIYSWGKKMKDNLVLWKDIAQGHAHKFYIDELNFQEEGLQPSSVQSNSMG